MRDPNTYPLCPQCLAFATEGGRDTAGTLALEGETCTSLEDGGTWECFGKPAKPTEPYEFFRVIFGLALDTGEVAPVDVTGTFDPAAGTFALQERDGSFFQCQRTDGPPNQYVTKTYVDLTPTETEVARIKAAAKAKWDAIDWEADRLAIRRERRADDDDAFQRGWDAYSEAC